MSESEAKRLGLVVWNIDTQLDDSSGAHLGIRIAVTQGVIIGGLHLKNVAFGVLSDAQEPFVHFPGSKRGISRNSCPNGDVDVAQETNWHLCFCLYFTHKNLSTSNLSFEESFPVTQVAFQRKLLDFTLDTGATHTALSPVC
jgi:hypothetical protein